MMVTKFDVANTVMPEVQDQHALIFQAWRCILGEHRHAIYVSGPITTGPRFVEARLHGSISVQDVLSANISDLLAAAAWLRGKTSRVVIEPGSLNVQSWAQEDYLNLWTNLIDRHIAEVRFLDGWETSIGCALEYERATHHAIDRRRLDGSMIEHANAVALLANSAARLANSSDERLVTLGERLAAVAMRLSA